MKKLIVIYGPPRSSTTFTLGCLVQHPYIFGQDPDKEKLSKGKTNENGNIDVSNMGNYDEIERLFNVFEIPEYCYLVIKAPGYCMAWDYFNNSPYECKYIFTNREKWSCVNSMMNHEPSFNVLKLNLESTDCPRDRLSFYEKLWKESELEGRALLRYHWHVDTIHPDMKKQSLAIDYTTRQKKIQNDFIYQNILFYLGIKDDECLRESLRLVKINNIKGGVKKDIKYKTNNVTIELGDF